MVGRSLHIDETAMKRTVDDCEGPACFMLLNEVSLAFEALAKEHLHIEDATSSVSLGKMAD